MQSYPSEKTVTSKEQLDFVGRSLTNTGNFEAWKSADLYLHLIWYAQTHVLENKALSRLITLESRGFASLRTPELQIVVPKRL